MIMKKLFTDINYLFKQIYTKKKESRNVEKQYTFLNGIQKNNSKLLGKITEEKNDYSLEPVSYNYSVNYIIGISFTKSNTHMYVTDSVGALKYYCSAGVLQHSGKNKKSRFYVLKNIYTILITRLTFLKKEPVALHLKNVDSNITNIINKLKRIAFIVTIKDFSAIPFNGCRGQKVPRKRNKKRIKKRETVPYDKNIDLEHVFIKIDRKQQPDYWDIYKTGGKFVDLKLEKNNVNKFVFFKTKNFFFSKTYKHTTTTKLFDWSSFFRSNDSNNNLNSNQNDYLKHSVFKDVKKQQYNFWYKYLTNFKKIKSRKTQFTIAWSAYLKKTKRYVTASFTQKSYEKARLLVNKQIKLFNLLSRIYIKLQLQKNKVLNLRFQKALLLDSQSNIKASKQSNYSKAGTNGVKKNFWRRLSPKVKTPQLQKASLLNPQSNIETSKQPNYNKAGTNDVKKNFSHHQNSKVKTPQLQKASSKSQNLSDQSVEIINDIKKNT